MAKNQIKRLAAPKTWPIHRKEVKWVAKPLPGTHKLEYSMALNVIIRDLLKLVGTSRDAKNVIRRGEIIINGTVIKEPRFAVGLYDVLSVPKLKKNYRVILTRKGVLNAIDISEKESSILPLKIRGKTIIKKGAQQINFSNGWNILSKDKYVPGDTVLFDTKSKKAVKHIAFKPGCSVAAIAGKHVGIIGTVKGLKLEGEIKKKKIALLETEKEKWSTSIDKLFVIGEGDPEFTAVMK